MDKELSTAIGGFMVGVAFSILFLSVIFGLTSPERFIDYTFCIIKVRG